MRRRGTRSARRKVRRAARLLQLEQLEVRQFLSAGGLPLPARPDWFADLAPGRPRHAGPAAMAANTAASTDRIHALSAAATNVSDWIIEFSAAAAGHVTSLAQTSQFLLGGGIHFEVLRGLGLEGQVLVRASGASPERVAAWLRADRQVVGFQADTLQQFQSVPNDAQFSQLWGLQNTAQNGGTPGDDINAPAAWSISTGSRNVVVAVVDTGVDYTHGDLAANIWTNSREIAGNGRDDDGDGFVDDVHGYNFADDNSNPMDDNGHGTHVAGTIGAVGNNGQGVAGVNWSVSIMPLKFLAADGSGYTSDAVRAINYVTMMRGRGVNVRVINASWGGGGSDPALSTAIRAAGDAGILFVAAAGNNHSNNDATPQYPANYRLPNAIAVAATDSNDRLASFSNYGASTVDLAAPGVGIYSTVPGGYAYYSGTSMATPHVAGVAALAWSAAPSATVAQIRAAILQGADPLPSLAGKVATGGRLDAYNTLRLLSEPAPSGPTIALVTATPNPVEAGAGVVLAAQGVSGPAGIAGVKFYRDANDNGVLDDGDPLLGSTTTVSGGQATITINTASLGPGMHRLLAVAYDSSMRLSNTPSTTLTVLGRDDHGNTAATATAVTVGSVTTGAIDPADDVDWFKFQAVFGRKYVFETALGTLPDSVMTLVAQDGQTVLDSNDDASPGNFASRIEWKATGTGTYYVAVGSWGGECTGSYSLQVTAKNTPPQLAPIANQAVRSGGALNVRLAAGDADGDRLTTYLRAYTISATAQRAYDLRQGLGLFRAALRDNARGWNERYFGSASGAVYFIVPNGTLYRLVNPSRIRQSTVVAQLTSAYYANPGLLTGAPQPNWAQAPGTLVGLGLSGNLLTVRPAPSFTGSVLVQVIVSDGQASAMQSFNVAVGSTNAANRARSVPASWQARSVPSLAARGLDRTAAAVAARAVDAVFAAMVSQG